MKRFHIKAFLVAVNVVFGGASNAPGSPNLRGVINQEKQSHVPPKHSLEKVGQDETNKSLENTSGDNSGISDSKMGKNLMPKDEMENIVKSKETVYVLSADVPSTDELMADAGLDLSFVGSAAQGDDGAAEQLPAKVNEGHQDDTSPYEGDSTGMRKLIPNKGSKTNLTWGHRNEDAWHLHEQAVMAHLANLAQPTCHVIQNGNETSDPSGTVHCMEGEKNCHLSTISGCTSITCVGNRTCEGLDATGFSSLICSGENSCKGAKLTSDFGSLTCSGDGACNDVEIDMASGNVTCLGPNSCGGLASISSVGLLKCEDGILSCASTLMKSAGEALICKKDKDTVVNSAKCMEPGEKDSTRGKSPTIPDPTGEAKASATRTSPGKQKASLDIKGNNKVEKENSSRRLDSFVTCVDKVSSSGTDWHHPSGSMMDCDWFKEGNRCFLYGTGITTWLGSINMNFGMDADEACCACGGGAEGCPAEHLDWLGDGYCDSAGPYNTAECKYDKGDCCEHSCEDGSYTCGSNGYDCKESLCGLPLNDGILYDLLNPPIVIQDILATKLGLTYNIGLIGGTAAEEECESLQSVMGTADAVWLRLATPDEFEYISFGEEASEKIEESCTRNCGSQKQQRSGSRGPKKLEGMNVKEMDPPVLPICVAVRPCDANNPAETFGHGVSFGIFFGGLEVPVWKVPEIAFNFHGIAASTFGDLTSLSPSADLWDNYQPKGGAHLHVEWGLTAPIGFKKISLGELSFTMKSQVYGEINGQADAGQLVSALMSGYDAENLALTPFNSEFLSVVDPQSALLQMTSTADVTFTLQLHEIFPIPFEIEVEMTLAESSTMIEFKYTKNDPSETWIDYRCTVQRDVAGGIKAGLKSFFDSVEGLGDLPKLLSEAIDMAPTSSNPMYGKLMLRAYATDPFKFDFGLEASLNMLTAGVWCGGYVGWFRGAITLAEAFLDLLDTFGDILEEFGLDPADVLREISKVVNTFIEVLDQIAIICANPPRIRIAFSQNQFLLEDACLIFGEEYKNELCLDMLPSCMGPSPNGAKCSENADCESGYCLNGEYWTSVGCLGTCMRKLDAGGKCDSVTLRALDTKLDPFTNEDEACQSGVCLCGSCANEISKKLPNGKDCSEDSDCESGNCMGMISIDCGGTCAPRQPDGACCTPECAEDLGEFLDPTSISVDEFCLSNRCVCGTCASSLGKLQIGSSCKTNCECNNSNCGGDFIGCDGTCQLSEWEFTMDYCNDDIGGCQNTLGPVQVEFYKRNGVRQRTIRYEHGLPNDRWVDTIVHGQDRIPAYVVVKIFKHYLPGMTMLGLQHASLQIDQAGIFASGEQVNWFGGEDGNSFSLSTSGGNGPCLIFELRSGGHGKAWTCAKDLMGFNYNEQMLKDKTVYWNGNSDLNLNGNPECGVAF